jgi:hypothetical protein
MLSTDPRGRRIRIPVRHEWSGSVRPNSALVPNALRPSPPVRKNASPVLLAPNGGFACSRRGEVALPPPCFTALASG